MPKGSRYGVHQFTQAEVSKILDQAFAAAQFTISSVLAYVAEMGASPSLIETGARVNPKQMRILTAEELIEWKVVFKGQEAPKGAVTPADAHRRQQQSHHWHSP